MIKSTLKYISEGLSDIWNVLKPDEKRDLSANFTIHNFRKNQVIYAEGEQPYYLWCLLRGKVKMYKTGIGDRTQILRLYRPIQYFGYRAYFANEPYVSSAAAVEPSVAGSIPLTLIDKLIHDNNDVAMFFIHELSRNLGGSDTKIVNLTQKHLRGRLADSLLHIVEQYGFEEDNATLSFYLSREDLASLSNMTTANAIRTLATFVDEKMILVDGRRIKIIDLPRLMKISKNG